MLQRAPDLGADIVISPAPGGPPCFAAMEEAAAQGSGAVSLDGRLIDAASIRKSESGAAD